MLVNIYTVYDKVAEECGPVFQAKNDMVAYRMIDSMVRENPNIVLEEYEVYCLGKFDTEHRSFVPEEDYGRLVDIHVEGKMEVNE